MNTIQEPKIKPDTLRSFFHVCEIDIKNSIRVIVERDIIRNLTHLQGMNQGGRKYYLLERESISAMIKAATRGLYKDFILINRHGIIVYTMVNDSIFAKRVKTSLINTPLYDCFLNTKDKIYIKDISEFPMLSNNLNLFISSQVVKENSLQGIFILQVDIKKIEKLINKSCFIIDYKGNYRVSTNRAEIFNPFPHFNKLRLTRLKNRGTVSFITEDSEYSYYPFRFKNLSWIVISEL